MSMNIQTDKPAALQSEDCFQRYEFAKRIASIVSTPKIDKSLIIGLYGKWGEGKTTVMNFIKAELPADTIVVNFNPWLFADEGALLRSFFSNLSIALGYSDKTKTEKLGELLSSYGEALGNAAQFINLKFLGAGVFLKLIGLDKIGNKLKNTSVERVKSRIDELIISTGKNIVVFVDDIDRLDIQETQYVFKLVKLVGDFPRTCYILSFDEEMVSASLAPKYGGNHISAGYNFLEKIIQLPIKIPKANKKSIDKHATNLLNNVLASNSVKLTEIENKEYIDIFNTSILPLMTNMRMGIRYANSLSFSLPLLNGEVHTGNLMVLEAIKIMFPELYDFLRSNSQVVLQRTEHAIGRVKNKEEIKSIINSAIDIYSAEKKQAALDILQKLFPQLQDLYINTTYPEDAYERWTVEKKICTPKYFDRYFSYTVEEGDIPDNYFKQMITGFEFLSQQDISSSISNAIREYSPFDLIVKFRQREKDFNAIQSEKLAIALAECGHYLPKEEDIHFATTYAQSANLIARLIRNVSPAQQLPLSLRLFTSAKRLEYAMEIHYWIMAREKSESVPAIFSSDAEVAMERHLVGLFLGQSTDENFFTLVSDSSLWKILIWWKRWDEKSSALTDFLNKHLSTGTNWQFALSLLKVFTPTITSFSLKGQNKIYKSGFFEQNYDAVKTVVDVKLLNKNIVVKFGVNPYIQSMSSISDRDPIEDRDMVSVFQGFIEKEQLK